MGSLWYALSVRTRFEKLVDAHLHGRGYETFLPTYMEKRQWSDRTKSLVIPLFPGYIFCRFDINAARLPILKTPGVNFIVGAGRTPLAVDESEIANVRQAVDSGNPILPWPYPEVGETVEIEQGPLRGIRGIVVRIENVERLVVSVSLLMRSVAVEIDRSSVKPINYPTVAKGCLAQLGDVSQ
jgi:transcription antitermination factor NusG